MNPKKTKEVNMCQMENHEKNKVNDPKIKFNNNDLFTISKDLNVETNKLKNHISIYKKTISSLDEK